MGHPQPVLEDVRAAWQPLEEEPRARVADRHVPADAIPEAPAREHVERLRQARTVIRQFEKLVVPVARHHEPHDEFITHLDRHAVAGRHELRPRLREPLHEQLLLDRELLAARSRHVGDVVEILPVDAAEGQALLGLRQRDRRLLGCDLAAHQARLEEPRARFDVRRHDRLAADRHAHELPGAQQVVAPAEQGAHRIGRRPAAGPGARALLRQEPHLERLDGRRVTGHLVEGLDHDRLRGDRGRCPAPPRRVRIAPPHPLPRILFRAGRHVGVDGTLPEAVHDRKRRIAVSGPMQHDREMSL